MYQMTARNETTPYGGEPDEFDLIAGGLLEANDPYVETMHADARLCEEIARMDGNSDPLVLGRLIAELDSKWRYKGKNIVVTGDFWIREETGRPLVKHRQIGITVISQGFHFISIATSEAEKVPTVGHYVELDRPDGQGRATGFIALDDIDEFILSEPSTEAREARFAYYYPDEAAWLDEINFTARRGDQVVADLAEFFIDIDPSTDHGYEKLKDTEQYMRHCAELEPLANYQITVVGDVIFTGDNGYGGPGNLKETFTLPVHINDIFLRPADMKAETIEGEQRYIPYIDVIAFLSNGADQRMLIPCSSIATMHSQRYDSAP